MTRTLFVRLAPLALLLLAAALPARAQTLAPPTPGSSIQDAQARVALDALRAEPVAAVLDEVSPAARAATRAATERATAEARRRAAAVTAPAWYRTASGAGLRGATITVNTLAGDDDGVCGTDPGDPLQDCSVLEAVALANSDPGMDVIVFSVSGTVALGSGLVLTEAVHLDGTTAPGGAGSVVLDGQNLLDDVVTVSGGTGTIIDALTVGRGVRGGIRIVAPASGATVRRCFIGTDAAGTDLGSGSASGEGGVLIDGSPGNTIGGTAPGEGNTIGFNRNGVDIRGAGATGNAVRGNWIGTNAAAANLGNELGVGIQDAPDNVVGAGNTIGFSRSGVIVSGPGATGNAIRGNFIGTNAAGANLGNPTAGSRGVGIQNGSSTTIGGANPGEGNTIGFYDFGVLVIRSTDPTTDHVVQGNWIGTNAAGAALPLATAGVLLQDASANTVGGAAAGEGNTVGHTSFGILISAPNTGTATGNVVAGNLVGTNAARAPLPIAGSGIQIQSASGNTIGGSAPGAGNVVGFSTLAGIAIRVVVSNQSATGNVVAGNLVGTDATGAPLGNPGTGILVAYASGNTIGGSAPGAGNTVGFNGSNGISVTGGIGTLGSDNVIAGNLVGTNAAGADLGNGNRGIYVENAGPTTIGGADPGAGNTVGFNTFGIVVNANDGNQYGGTVIQGNFVGTNAAGADLGNVNQGISIELRMAGTLVGGTEPGAGNTVGFNNFGIVVGNTTDGFEPTFTTIEGNYVGTNEAGADLGNSGGGVYVGPFDGTTGRVLNTVIEGNTVGFNDAGLFLNGTGLPAPTLAVSNFIGTNAAGADLGNTINGVLIRDVWDTAVVENEIRFNGIGVRIEGAAANRNPILSNGISDSDGLGIDLAADESDLSGVTPNDPDDLDAGPNGFQNYPVLTGLTPSGGDTEVSFTLDSTPSTSFRVELFASGEADPTGFGEGARFLGETTVTTDASGDAAGALVVAGLAAGEAVSATATVLDPAGLGGFGGTSEFSAVLTVTVEPNEPPVADAGPDQTVIAGQTVTLDGSGSSDPDGDPLTYAWTLNGPGYADETLTGEAPTFCAATDGAFTASLVVNDGTEGSDPDAVTVTAITPTAALDALLADVEALYADGTLNAGQARGLGRNLVQAQRLLERGKTAEALVVLAGFRQQALDLWQLDGVLTEAEAMALVAAVDAVTGALAAPCTAAPAPLASATTGGPDLVGLGAAYPNPARAGVTVPYGLAEAGTVRLALYDALGREVAVLVDGAVEAGRHTAVLDGSALPSGVYLVRLTTGGGLAQTQRVTLVR